MTALACTSCKRECDVATFCAALDAYAPVLDFERVRCPSCGASHEVRVENGAVWFGYVAAAGAAYFCAMVEVPVSGLSRRATATRSSCPTAPARGPSDRERAYLRRARLRGKDSV